MYAKENFPAVAVVALPYWSDLDQATVWCERRWRLLDCKYRRRIDAANSAAVFEFAREIDGLAFRLVSSRRFRPALTEAPECSA